MRGWSGDYVCCDCGYNDSKDAFGERGKNEFVKINKEREGNEKKLIYLFIYENNVTNIRFEELKEHQAA
ncbi:hypothetical protein [Escherichia coli]|uniref:hypothetical protein n=1 Tax=Escherichia coli TaxID=562 RepID=UPI001FF3379F|nr:hypothetical protein [Escherichia coli]MDZ9692642.1 hypothetical protein [Escherichia coli]